jgi:hypothetical protein
MQINKGHHVLFMETIGIDFYSSNLDTLTSLLFSDFVAMSGVPVIRFTELNSSRYNDYILDENPETIGHYHVRVFRREITARICGLTESQFVEWCILSGNDFTSSFEMTHFDVCRGSSGNEEDQKNSGKKKDMHSGALTTKAKERSGDAKRIIKSQREDFHLTSTSNAKLHMAIEYSRDFYELRDLSKYPIDPPDDEPQLVALSLGDCAAISHWIESHRHGFDVMKLQHIGRTAWNVLKEISISSQNDDFSAENLFDHINPVYLNTLLRMLTSPLLSSPVISQQMNFQFKHPNWRDIMFTHHYQLVCKYLLKCVRKSTRRDSEILMGFQIFNAELFYSLLHEEQLKAAMANLSIVPSSNSAKKATKKIDLPQGPSEIQTPKAKKLNSTPTPQKESKSGQAIQQTNLTPPPPPPQQNNEIQKSKAKTKKQKKTRTVTPSTPPNFQNPRIDDLPDSDGDFEEDKVSDRETLPIDAHRREILHRIRRDRVTIIQGETGCGKSSRIPVMLLEDAQRRGEKCRMMVSQPRRIAATTLMKRVRATLGMQV